MQMTGEQRVFAPRERVWAALNDPNVLAQCLPDSAQSHRTEDRGWNAIATGPLEARGARHLRLSERDAPYACTIVGLGAVSDGGEETQTHVRLSDDGQGRTLVSYHLNPHVEGGEVPSGAQLDPSAHRYAGNFFSKFGEVVANEKQKSEVATGQDEMWANPAAERVAGEEAGAAPVWGWVGALVMAIVIGYMLGRTGSVLTTLGGIVLLIVTAACAYEAGRKSTSM